MTDSPEISATPQDALSAHDKPVSLGAILGMEDDYMDDEKARIEAQLSLKKLFDEAPEGFFQERDLRTLEMTYWDEMEDKDIGKALGVPTKRVAKYREKALHKLGYMAVRRAQGVKATLEEFQKSQQE